MIVDIRLNDGGWDAVAMGIAKRFSDKRRLAFPKKARFQDGFTDLQRFEIYPEGDRQFTGPVILLMGYETISAAETFVMCMKSLPYITTIGMTTNGYGWANIEKKIPMTPDAVQNIASISKTITATAVMQLWEKGLFKLDDDVNEYLSFKVRNPRFPDIPLTFRQLLTHRSSIKDGSAYDESYSPGDPEILLETWTKEYLIPGGKYYKEKENFHSWKPGETGKIPEDPSPYSNVGFGFLGYLVETISGMPFSDHTRENIFEPLSMNETSWYIKDI